MRLARCRIHVVPFQSLGTSLKVTELFNINKNKMELSRVSRFDRMRNEGGDGGIN